jgi:hypothetical protein
MIPRLVILIILNTWVVDSRNMPADGEDVSIVAGRALF